MKLMVGRVALGVSVIAIGSQPVSAQELTGLSGNVDEILVTARKKPESVLKVPITENILSQQTLEISQINNIRDVTSRIPGLTVGSASLTIGELLSLRGVGTNAQDQGIDQSVSLNVDGLQLTQGLAFRAASFDLEQVEVLKGPQALFFGKNSTAGVISFRSADPTSDFLAKATVGYELATREKRGELILSGPLSKELGARFAGMVSQSEGMLRNRATAAPGLGGSDPRYTRNGGGKSWIMRGTLLWEPSSDFTARLKVNAARDDLRSGGLDQVGSCPDGTGGLPSLPWTYFSPDENCKLDKTIRYVDMDPAAYPGIRNNGTPFLDIKQQFGTLDLRYDLSPSISLSSVTGVYNVRGDTLLNATYAGFAGPALYAENILKRREFTEELRLESDFSDSQFNFMLGAYYQNGKVSNDFVLGGNTTQGLPPIMIRGKSSFDIRSYSAFGQLRWHPTEKVELAVGARHTNEKRDLTVFDRLAGTRVSLAPGADRISSKNWSPEATLTYTPTDAFTIFAALKQAYKSGSFNIVLPAAPGSDPSFGDERARGGEVGIKSRWMDRALSFDVSAYYYNYAGLQTGVNSPAESGIPTLRTLNAGKARIYGIDMEAHYRLPSVDGLTLNLAGNWNKSKFLKLDNVPCFGGQLISQGCNQLLNPTSGLYTAQTLNGSPFVRAPEWQINFGFDYSVPFGNDYKLSLSNNNQYSSSFLAVLDNPAFRPGSLAPKSLKVDFAVTLFGPEERWRISLAGKNLTDQLRQTFCNNFNYAGGTVFSQPISGGTIRNESGQDEATCSVNDGRTVSVRFSLKI